MSEHDRYEFDQPAGDEFGELLAAMHSSHIPEQFEQYARRIPELISAVRQARKERDATLTDRARTAAASAVGPGSSPAAP